MQALVLAFQGNENIHHLLIYRSSALRDFSKALKSLAIGIVLERWAYTFFEKYQTIL